MKIRFGLYRGLTLRLDPANELMFYAGLYEIETSQWLARHGKGMRSLIDVGAGCGELSMWALKHPQVERVLAYDASAERWPIFENNLRDNGFESDARLKAVHGFFLGSKGSDTTLTMIHSLPEPVLIRIDVEGAEAEILGRMTDVMSTKKMFFLVETHSAELDRQCGKILREKSYDVKNINKAWWRCLISERRPLGFNQWLVAERMREAVGRRPKD